MVDKRHWDKLNLDISMLGFGCMRFPVKENGEIDEEKAEAMIDKAYASGVNYYDTAYFYHNGASEVAVGKFLKKYPRESFYLATKLPVMLLKDIDKAQEIFDEQLKRLGFDYVDFYLLHGLNKHTFEITKNLDVIKFCESSARKAASATSASPSMTATRSSRKSSAITTGISARFSSTIWTSTSRPA